jgi:hypothetical protein
MGDLMGGPPDLRRLEIVKRKGDAVAG